MPQRALDRAGKAPLVAYLVAVPILDDALHDRVEREWVRRRGLSKDALLLSNLPSVGGSGGASVVRGGEGGGDVHRPDEVGRDWRNGISTS